MIAAMSDPDPVSPERTSILGSLPNTRPQRASARRTAARGAAQARTAAAQAKPPAKAKKPAAKSKAARSGASPAAKQGRPTARPAARRAAAKAQLTAPRQGFESDGDLASGSAVQPPSSTEIVASVVEVFGDLAQSGLAGGGRLVKDALTRLLRG
jgi:hypothetical protein